MRLLLGLAGALLLASLGEIVEPRPQPPRLLGWLLVGLALPLGRVTLHALALRRRNPPRTRTLFRSFLGACIDPVLFLAGLALILFPLGWVHWSLDGLGWRGQRFMTLLLGLVPAAILAGLLAPWAYMEATRGRRSPPSPGFVTWLAGRLRLLVLPVTILLLVVGSADLIEAVPGCEELLSVYPAFLVVLASLLLLVLFALSPLLFRIAIPTARLPDGEPRRLLETLARTLGLRPPALRLWSDGQGGLLNACAAGILPAPRMVALTRALHDFLEPGDIAAVGAHEMAHLKQHHMPCYLLLGLAFLFSLAALESVAHLWPPWVEILVFLVLLWSCWRLLFGRLSRLFELEADIVGARTVGSTAYSSTLQRVEILAGPDARHGNWRHPGTTERVAAVLSSDESGQAARILARCRRARILIGIALLGSLITLGWVLVGQFSRPEAILSLEKAGSAQASAEEIRPVVLDRLKDPRPAPDGLLALLYRSDESLLREYRSALDRAASALEKAPRTPERADLAMRVQQMQAELEAAR